MQKILRRVATAERVANKRKRTKQGHIWKQQKKQDMSDQTGQVRMARDEIKAAKQAIRNDWSMGALSPRTDVGDWQGAYGTIGEYRFSSAGRFTFAQRDARCQWAGGARYLNLAPGDRVVLLEGPDKGRIGPIYAISSETAEVTVEGLNKSNIRLNPLMKTDEFTTAVNLEIPLPVSSVRLVYPITDPSTGKTRDVIINQLVSSGLVIDRQSGKKRWDRVVPGLNISIPWPEKADPRNVDHKSDTLRIDVEEKTFVPTLLRPPMPLSVIDELRGKYSRFRTRHEPEYIARLEAEEQAKKDRAKLIESMRTPLQEYHRAERENKKKKGKPRLTLEMLEKIGEVIAKSRERTLNAAGVSDAVPPNTSSDVPPPTSSDARSSPPPPPT
ncbi:hypothetical protein EKO27_g3526 [Xylaria grammica]|uniref:KOW domain-containing protein n=1 Tax=Xylaria grammica TaxID=363999 RepID=A0A439DAV6_9PEZI|nr:hypothetical protein EKO27_g3526 [Xylaria grammica]